MQIMSISAQKIASNTRIFSREHQGLMNQLITVGLVAQIFVCISSVFWQASSLAVEGLRAMSLHYFYN